MSAPAAPVHGRNRHTPRSSLCDDFVLPLRLREVGEDQTGADEVPKSVPDQVDAQREPFGEQVGDSAFSSSWRPGQRDDLVLSRHLQEGFHCFTMLRSGTRASSCALIAAQLLMTRNRSKWLAGAFICLPVCQFSPRTSV